MEILSRRMRDLRVDSDLKQHELAEALGVSQNMISNYENGREPPFEFVLKLADYFGVSFTWLVGLTNEKKPHNPDETKLVPMIDATLAAGHDPFTRGDLETLADKFLNYYAAGAPAGSIPMDMMRAFIDAMGALLDAAASGNAAATLLACNDATRAALLSSDVITAMQKKRKKPTEKK